MIRLCRGCRETRDIKGVLCSICKREKLLKEMEGVVLND